MKNIIIAIGVLFSFILMPSCSDFLEHEQWGPSTEWKTEADIRVAIGALYEHTALEPTGGRGFMWFECCSDNVVPGKPRASADEIRNFQMTPDNGNDAKGVWASMYTVNARANNLVELVPTLALSEAFKEKATGIGYFFKGYSMLWIAPFYGDNGDNGGVPIITSTPNPEEDDKPRPASVLENYDQIIADLRVAGEKLPLFSELDPTTEYGFPHKAAAWSYAARAALYAAQYDNKYYDIVIEMTNKVINLAGADKRDLYDDETGNAFANYWTREQNFCSEYIFSMLGSAMEGPKFHGVGFNGGGYNIINTWGYYQPTLELYQAYEQGDIRRDATILMPGDRMPFVGNDILFGGISKNTEGVDKLWDISSSSGMTFRKFMSPWADKDCIGKDVSSNGNNMSNTLGTCMMRFADVLLMKAEALIWIKGEGNAEAKALLNRIRKRADLPENSQATKADLKQERRVELAFEFQTSRHLDLVRWGDAKTQYAKPQHGITSKWDETTKTVVVGEPIVMNGPRTFDPKKNHVFPIPSSAFAGTKNLKQNIGY